MKPIYNDRYEKYSTAFSTNINNAKAENSLTCFAQFLWHKGEQELIKKFLLREVFQEIDEEHRDM